MWSANDDTAVRDRINQESVLRDDLIPATIDIVLPSDPAALAKVYGHPMCPMLLAAVDSGDRKAVEVHLNGMETVGALSSFEANQIRDKLKETRKVPCSPAEL